MARRPPRAGIAQIVERGVIALGDIAAIAGVDRRLGDQRAREQVDQRAMAPQLRQQFGEQRRRRRRCCRAARRSRHAPSRPSRSWPRSRGLPRPAATRPERAADIGQRRASAARGHVAQPAVVVEALRPDRAVPRSCARSISGAAMSWPSSRAPAPVTVRSTVSSRLPLRAPDCADGESRGSRASPRRSPSPHRRGGTARRAQEGQRSLGGVIEIGDQPARRRRARRARSCRNRRASPRRTGACQPASPLVLSKPNRVGAPVAEHRRSAMRVASDRLGGRSSRAISAVDAVGIGSITSRPAGRDVGAGDRRLAAASPIATHQFALRLSSSDSSVSVPAVTTRTIARADQRLGAPRACVPARASRSGRRWRRDDRP